MTIYIVMIDDKHTDTDAVPFTNPEAAVAYAREAAAEAYGEYDEQHIPGWLFSAFYGGDENTVWVVEKELRES